MGEKKVVIDTNVWVSAFRAPGVCQEIVYLASDGLISIYTSESLLSELSRVLGYPKCGLGSQEAAAILRFVRMIGTIVEPNHSVTMIKADPADNRVLEAAIASRADVIVSGDKHLLEVACFEGIMILSPSMFLKDWLVVGTNPKRTGL